MSNYFEGLFSSNHSTTALIAHTAPDDNIASKNQLTLIGVPNNTNVGENITNDKNQPEWKLKHSGQVKIPDINLPTPLNNCLSLSPHLWKKFLSP